MSDHKCLTQIFSLGTKEFILFFLEVGFRLTCFSIYNWKIWSGNRKVDKNITLNEY